MKNPYFSVIIPVYNEEKLIQKCLDSIFKQNYNPNDFEVIVVNNNCTDNSVTIAKKYKTRIVNQSKQGIVMARQKGLEVAKGEIIINLDADCIVPKNWLKKYYQNFSKNKNLVFLSGIYITPDKGIFCKIITIFPIYWQKVFNSTIGFWGGNCAIKKSVLNKINGYDLRFPNSDQLSILTKLKKFGNVILDKNIYVFSSDRRTKRTLKNLFEFSTYLLDIITVKLFNKSVLRWENIR